MPDQSPKVLHLSRNVKWLNDLIYVSRYVVMLCFNFEQSYEMVWESSYKSLNIYYEYKGVHLNKDTLYDKIMKE